MSGAHPARYRRAIPWGNAEQSAAESSVAYGRAPATIKAVCGMPEALPASG